MNRDSPERLDLLAGEYVMGTLTGRARRRFESWLRADPMLQQRVRAWEARLGHLTDGIAPRTPPDRVWRQIEGELGLRPERQAASGPSEIWDSTPFWRNLAFAASLLMAVLGTYLVAGPQGATEWEREMIVHVLEDRKALEVQRVVSRDTLTDALEHTSLQLTGDLGEATFLGHCVVGDRMGIHLVVNTVHGRATIIVIPGAHVSRAQRHVASGYAASVLPLGKGLIGLITESTDVLPQVEELVRRNITVL